MDFDTISLDRSGAAVAAGVTEAQITNWMAKNRLFPEKRHGSGTNVFFLFRDVMTLAAIKALIDAGLQPPVAVQAVRSYSVYGTLLHNPADGHFPYPGTFFLSLQSTGMWAAIDWEKAKVALHIHMWPIFDEVLPRFIEQLRGYAKKIPAEQLDEIIGDYQAAMENLRAQRWNDV